MAAGKLTSRFGDGNSSDGGSWDRGPFGGGNLRFLSWSPFLLFSVDTTMLMFQTIFDCLFYFSPGWITRWTFLIPLLLFPRNWTTCIVLANVCWASVKHFIIKYGQHHLVGEGNQILSTPPAHKSSICWTKETLLLQFCKRSFGKANQVCLSEFHTAMT